MVAARPIYAVEDGQWSAFNLRGSIKDEALSGVLVVLDVATMGERAYLKYYSRIAEPIAGGRGLVFEAPMLPARKVWRSVR